MSIEAGAVLFDGPAIRGAAERRKTYRYGDHASTPRHAMRLGRIVSWHTVLFKLARSD
jgi:hypothetical protein